MSAVCPTPSLQRCLSSVLFREKRGENNTFKIGYSLSKTLHQQAREEAAFAVECAVPTCVLFVNVNAHVVTAHRSDSKGISEPRLTAELYLQETGPFRRIRTSSPHLKEYEPVQGGWGDYPCAIRSIGDARGRHISATKARAEKALLD